MPALINIKTDLTKLRSQPKPFNTQIFSYSSNLTELRTNLTQLKFGSDQPGYGSSGLPYIQTTIPPVPNLLNAKGPGFPLYTPGTPASNPDYPIRGGAVEFQIGQQTYTLASQIDKTRIRRFFEDKQRGPLFIQKQIGLQLTNPKMEVGNTLFGIGQGAPIPGLLEITRVYNRGENTLAQVGVQGTGAHAVRHGLVPFNLFQKNYYAIVNAQNVNNEGMTNRLLNLNALKMSVGTSPFVNPQNVLDINTVNTLGISLNRNLLFQYLGGPGSAYGIGNTTIKRAVDTTKLRSSRVMTYDQIKQQTSNKGNIVVSEAEGEIGVKWLQKTTYAIKDFRKDPAIRDNLDGSYNASDKSVEDRFYESSGIYKDRMNASLPFVYKNDIAPWEYNKKETDDLIKFVFEAVSNDNTQYSTAIFFRAFLTSGITDNNSAQWNNFKYLGRGENFYTYQGFDRSISFSFRVAAESKSDLVPMYKRINTLVSQVYPDYSPKSSVMRAPIIVMTIGDYINRMPGFLESVNVSVSNDTTWEIDDSNQLPQVVDISVSFKPILNSLPKRSNFVVGEEVPRFVNTPTIFDLTQTETYNAELKSVGIVANNLTSEKIDTAATRVTGTLTRAQYLNSAFPNYTSPPLKLTVPRPSVQASQRIIEGTIELGQVTDESGNPYKYERKAELLTPAELEALRN